MNRRDLLKSLAAAPLAQPPSAAAPPNILLVLSDDHSAPYLGCYGADWIATPNLDRFASEGLLFERAFTAAPQCVPSRTALITGRSPVAARMGRFSSPLPPDIPAVPDLLRARNYYTGVGGRYFHLDGVNNPSPTTARTYDALNLRTFKDRVDLLDVSPQAQTPALLDRFLSAVPQGRPFFCWLNFSDPHHPWQPDTPIDPARVKVPAHLPDLPGVRADLARYGAEIQRADHTFGQLLAVLEKRGLRDNTLVVFMGDNGMAFPHGKGSLYDPGTNVPLIARWPGRTRPGRTRTLISGEDIAATFIHAAGAQAPAGLTGHSFLPLLTGQPYQPRKHVFSARLHHGNSSFTPQTRASTFDLSRAVRSDRYKLIYNVTPSMEYWPVDSAQDPGWQQILAAHKSGTLSPQHERAYFQNPRPVLELYDLDNDPAELQNLAGQPQLAPIQQQLAEALLEKQIIDRDFVPPILDEARPRTPPRAL